jgi:alpha-glucosidase
VEASTQVDIALGTTRARAAAVLLLSLPGAAYIYNGQELGLPNVDDLPDEVLQDPSFYRTNGEVRGRDGCRIPLPWSHDATAAGFSSASDTWLPIPEYYRDLAVDVETADPASMLHLYRELLRIRRAHSALRRGSLSWIDTPPAVLAYSLTDAFETVEVWFNFGDTPTPLPDGYEVLVSSTFEAHTELAPNSAAICLKVPKS